MLETGTLGVRVSDSNRFIVDRSMHDVDLNLNGSSFHVNYKKFSFKGKTDFKIEFDDLKKISNILEKSIKETDVLLRKEINQLENYDDAKS